jgi:translation initiation factor IF-3
MPLGCLQADVVMINEDGEPPVVRLVAFSKYKYELEKGAKKKQKASKA